MCILCHLLVSQSKKTKWYSYNGKFAIAMNRGGVYTHLYRHYSVNNDSEIVTCFRKERLIRREEGEATPSLTHFARRRCIPHICTVPQLFKNILFFQFIGVFVLREVTVAMKK